MNPSLRILHLEDDAFDAELIASALNSAGITCDIVRVQDRDEFIRALEGGGVDLILADYSLPSFDGASALSLARGKCPEIPYIFVSGKLGEDVAVEALKKGAADYVLKDRLSRLAPSVQRALREARERQARKQAEVSLKKLNRVYAVLSSVNRLVVRAADQQTLFDGVCRILVEEGLFRMAWIGLVDEAARVVRPVACMGCEDGYLEKVNISIDDVAEGNGPTGLAVRNALHFINNDTGNNPAMLPWRAEAIARGYISSAAFPLVTDGKAMGSITVYAAEAGFFDDDEVRLLDGLAADISYALKAMEQEGRRERAEAQARELGERLHALVDESAEVGAFIMQDGRIVFANPCGYRMFGYEAGSTPGISELVHADDLVRASELYTSMIRGEVKRNRIEIRCLRKDGSAFDAEVFGFLSAFQGRPAIIGTIIDITERKRAEEKLVRAKEEWERTFDSVPDMIAILDRKHRIVRVNEAMARRLGFTPEQCIGLPCYKYVHGLSAPPDFCPHSRTINDGRQHIQEVHEDRLGGDFLVSTTPLRDENGQMMGSVHVAHDITARKQAERQRQDFYAMVTHDLKSPLTTILGYSELILSKEKELGKDVLEFTAGIERSGEKLLQMVEDFLAVSRLESGVITLKKTRTDISRLLADGCRFFEVQAIKKDLDLKCKAGKEPLNETVDRKYVEMAISNLIQNAVNYTPRGGRIRVDAQKESDGLEYLIISVTDSGPGIAPEEKERVFEKYHRLPGSGVKGSGLGLAIVKAVAEAHKGRVELESEPGRGSTFKLILPV